MNLTRHFVERHTLASRLVVWQGQRQVCQIHCVSLSLRSCWLSFVLFGLRVLLTTILARPKRADFSKASRVNPSRTTFGATQWSSSTDVFRSCLDVLFPFPVL